MLSFKFCRYFNNKQLYVSQYIRFYSKKRLRQPEKKLDLRGYQPIIGLEVHAQIKSKAKLFSGASTMFAGMPNTQVSLIDAAFPGTLPVINKYCVFQAVRTGLALQGKIHHKSQFDRKHYFYPDLPQGYQITQRFHPIMTDGKLVLDLPSGGTKVITIERLQIEQDSGKSIHDQDPHYSLIDLNRAGVALMEIVSNPDITSPEEAEVYLKTLQHLVRHIGTCDGNMEEGSFRCDINISVHKPGTPFGTRCEIKNLAGINSAVKAIEYEIERQIQLLEEGKEVEQETRVFDAKTNTTILLRSKENAPDYRYLPDPDLPPLIITDEFIEEARKSLPELPEEIKERFTTKYGLSKYDAHVLLMANATQYFEEVAVGRNPKATCNWITSELFGQLNKEKLTLDECPITKEQIGSIIDLVESDVISFKVGKQVLELMFMGDKRLAKEIVKENNWEQLSDAKVLNEICDKVLQKNQEAIKQYFEGKEIIFKFFVGSVMKETKGRANPKMVTDIITELLQKYKSSII